MREFLVVFENNDCEIHCINVSLNSEQKANEETFMNIIDSKFISYFDKPLRIYSWSLIEK